jgi:hypothetical protein
MGCVKQPHRIRFSSFVFNKKSLKHGRFTAGITAFCSYEISYYRIIPNFPSSLISTRTIFAWTIWKAAE